MMGFPAVRPDGCTIRLSGEDANTSSCHALIELLEPQQMGTSKHPSFRFTTLNQTLELNEILQPVLVIRSIREHVYLT